MLKIFLKLKAKKDISSTSWKEGDIYEFYNDIFDQSNGIAYHPLDINWEILEMKVINNRKKNKTKFLLKLLHESDLDRCESAEDMQYALERIYKIVEKQISKK